LLTLLPAGSAPAFYSVEGDNFHLGLRGTMNAGVAKVQYPETIFIFSDADESAWNGDFRLLADATVGDNFRAEANVLENVRSTPVFVLPGSRAARQTVERSSAFLWQQHDSDNTQAFLVLDSGSFSISNVSNDLTIGRQPVNLSVTFYFTPNDFFAPFAPQHFYREYKSGVDALRYERRLADLTQLTFLAVLGYDTDPDSQNGWSSAPDWQRTSLIGRVTHILGEYELGVFGGTLADYAVAGASLQGDVFPWLGVRAECNYRDTRTDDLADGLQVSVGIEHRYSGRLIARLEQMYNGLGYATIREADKALMEGVLRPGYLGREYTAFDISYEFSPLLTGEMLYLHNWTDYSSSFSLYWLYSLSDESELALTINLPLAEKPDQQSLNSEFGILPAALTLEYRLYF